MAETDFRAKFVALYRDDKTRLGRRQMPLVVDETLTVVVQFNNSHGLSDNVVVKHKEISNFIRKYNLFTPTELTQLLTVDEDMLNDLMSRVVPCVGCRRSIERFYNQLMECCHPALDPLDVNKDGNITVANHYTCNPKRMCNLFSRYGYGSKLNSFIESIPKTKKNRRCLLHSLDSHKVRPAGNWLDVWEQMAFDCQEEVVIIERDVLLETLETYLRKHRFCGECKSKVLQAFNLLVEEADSSKEKDFLPSLYKGMRYCSTENHIHVECNTDFVANLMSRAEPELRGSRREKHAKTIDVAQEEVLVCIGICLYERLHRISQRMREEEQTWQIMFYLGVECLKTKFEMTVEMKQGKSQLELLCEEIQLAELAKQQKREHKRQKRKQKKNKLRSVQESNECRRTSVCLCDENTTDISLCKLCIERGSRSDSRASTPEENDGPFSNSSPHNCEDSHLDTALPVSPIVTPELSTCLCSSNRFLSDELTSCGDSGYLSGANNDSPWSNSSSSCESCDGVYAESCCSHEDECLNCRWSKATTVLCDSPLLLDKCRHCIRELSPTEEIIHKAVPFDGLSEMPLSLNDLLETFCPSDEDYIPPEELREMRAKVRQDSQERIKFRENLRRRFQDLQKMTKFRFRPFTFCKLSNHCIGQRY